MGVPRFFSWITRRYPMIIQDMEEYQLPQIDCLYLDMNGIIYRCSKDESIIFKAQIMSREIEQIWFSIFNYVNAIVDAINPRKLLFMGLDGVAPRAKMNNQRSRRYCNAKDYKQLERKLQHYGNSKNQEQFKNNCITPGTEFMSELNRQLRFFISKKIEEDPRWRKFNVIFSGADVPGEGQHKIMDFIRQSTKLNVYDDTTAHCLYGSDADLIMLGMSLKIKKIFIIREEFIAKSKKVVISKARNLKNAKFKIIYVNVLKEYFDLEYRELKNEMKIPYDYQRILNDFVFLCFFIGNDFLPRSYCYDIREGNLDVLINGFKMFLKVCEDYIVHEDHMNLKELQRLTKLLSKFENMFIGDQSDDAQKVKKIQGSDTSEIKSQMKESEKEMSDGMTLTSETLLTENQFLLKTKALYTNEAKQSKNMFYEIKLKFSPTKQPQKLKQLLDDYVQGLQYVYEYYFVGLPSWQWYYPHYYAPMIGDLHAYLSYMNSASIQIKPFNKSQPYEPFKQLLCTLPQESVQLLPKCLRHLIEDEQSPLRTPINYFPDHVEVDPYGGMQEYEFINILPFIDRHKITEIYNSIPQDRFTPQELARNKFSQNQLYQADSNALTKIRSFYTQISDFEAHMSISFLDFNTDDVLKLKRNAEPLTDVETKLTFPTLYIQEFESELAFGFNQDRMVDIILKQNPQDEDSNFKLGSEVYFGYPFESHGRVMAIATERDFRCVKEFDIMDFIVDYDIVESDFKEDRDYWKEGRKQCTQKGLQLPGNKIYFLCQSQINHRKQNGEYARSFLANTSLYLTVDATLVSAKPKYAFTQILYKPIDMYDEFKIGQEVVILKDNKDNKDGNYAGSKGIVMGYHEQYHEILIKITDPTPEIPEKILRSINSTNEPYIALDFFFSAKFIANTLKINLQILLDALDSVQVTVNTDYESAMGMPKTLDIGLNFIKRNEKKLVPSLARLPGQGMTPGNLFKAFFDLEISGIAVNLLCDYKKEFPQIFTFLDNRMDSLIAKSKKKGRQIEWHEEIKASDIYPHEKDPNIPITKLYIWLLKKEQIHMPNAAINSKAVSKQKLSEVLKYFKEMKPLNVPSKQVAFDPNYLFSNRLSEKGVPHLSKNPPAHKIADRVICLHEAYFGQRAIIVGIDNKEYEVLFERPSFGKNSLGGKVDYLWGGKFEYSELYNINIWSDLIEPRYVNGQPNKTIIRICWDGQAPEFVAIFKNTAISSFKDYNMLASVINLPCFAIEEYMNKQDKNEFQVVVDKRNKNRTLYPKDDDKKLIDDIMKGGADLKKVVNELAMKKEAFITETLEEQEIIQITTQSEQNKVKKIDEQEKKERPLQLQQSQKASHLKDNDGTKEEDDDEIFG